MVDAGLVNLHCRGQGVIAPRGDAPRKFPSVIPLVQELLNDSVGASELL